MLPEFRLASDCFAKAINPIETVWYYPQQKLSRDRCDSEAARKDIRMKLTIRAELDYAEVT